MPTNDNERLRVPEPISNSRVVAILRGPSTEYVVQAAVTLVSCGIRCIEVTLTIPGAIDVIAELSGLLPPDALIVAGSVMSGRQAERAIKAGARALVSPVWVEEIVAAAGPIAYLPGAATPTEIVTAWNGGATAVKVFPASTLGGPAFLRSIGEPLPEIPLVPTGGIHRSQAAEYLHAGAIAIGVGSSLIGDALMNGSLEALRLRAAELLTSINSVGDDAL